MSNAKSIKKLTLNRETLRPLQTSELEDVNGGTSSLLRLTRPIGAWVTRNVCGPVAAEGAIRGAEALTRAGGGPAAPAPAPYGSNPQRDTSATGCR